MSAMAAEPRHSFAVSADSPYLISLDEAYASGSSAEESTVNDKVIYKMVMWVDGTASLETVRIYVAYDSELIIPVDKSTGEAAANAANWQPY